MKLNKGRIVYLLVGILVGIVMVVPVQAAAPSIKKEIKGLKKWVSRAFYTKKNSDAKYAAKNSLSKDYYTKQLIDGLLANYYSKTDADSKFYSKIAIDALLANTYTKDQVNNTSSLANYYTKTDADDRYVNAFGDSIEGNLYVNKTGPFTGGNITAESNISATNFSYSQERTRYLTIPGIAFMSTGSYYTAASPDGFDVWNNNQDGMPDAYYAPVNLPDGATITEVYVKYYDNDSGGITVTMNRVGLLTDSIEPIATIDLFAAGANPNYSSAYTTTIANGVINDNYYAYNAKVYFSTGNSNLRLRAVKITYTVPGP